MALPEFADNRGGVQNVTLRSAARLEQDQEFEIAKQMQEATQSKNIKIKPVVDEALMGGFIVEWGDNQVRLRAPSPPYSAPLCTAPWHLLVPT